MVLDVTWLGLFPKDLPKREKKSFPPFQEVDIAKPSYLLNSALFLLPECYAEQAGAAPDPGWFQHPAGLQSPEVICPFGVFRGCFLLVVGV